MKMETKEYQVPAGTVVSLDKWPTKVKSICESKKAYRKLLKHQVEEMSELQRLHYASDRYSLLLIFQAMDAVDVKLLAWTFPKSLALVIFVALAAGLIGGWAITSALRQHRKTVHEMEQR